MAKDYKVCLDIGGTKILGAIFDANGQIVYKLKKKTKSGGDNTGNVEQVIVSVVKEMLAEYPDAKGNLAGIAAGAPGVIDQSTGIILFSPNLPWRNYDIRTPMQKQFGVPFYIGNDVNLGVLGEYIYGAAQGCTNVAGFFVGTGMGGGLVLDGRLYTGTGFKAAEYGHMVVQPDGPLCNCGQRGCLEAFASKRGMSAYITEQAARGRVSLLADKITNGVFRSGELKKALKAKDAVAVEAVDRACRYLAVATGNIINTISPDMIVYGGGVMEAVGNILLDKITAQVDLYCMPSIRSTVKLACAGLGDDSILYGALAMIEGKA